MMSNYYTIKRMNHNALETKEIKMKKRVTQNEEAIMLEQEVKWILKEQKYNYSYNKYCFLYFQKLQDMDNDNEN